MHLDGGRLLHAPALLGAGHWSASLVGISPLAAKSSSRSRRTEATVYQCCDDEKFHRVSGGKMVTAGLLIRVETKPDKVGELEALLIENLKKVEKEEATTVCLAMRLGPTSFGVVTAFPDDAGRQAHLAANADVLAQAAELLTQPPSIERLEVIAAKLPNR
jgi:quinol monooxygenase YgiN